MKRLDEIEARTNAATVGPWDVFMDRIDHPGKSVFAVAYDVGCDEDAEFIAAARQDVPALVAVARFAISQHAQDGHGNCGPCDDAAGEDGWPCSTVREIRRLLGEGD